MIGRIPSTAPGLDEIEQAAARLSGRIRATELRPSAELSRRWGREVLLKLECQQITGSFKLRGALNALASLSAAEARAGVVTASAGNHGAGVAHAARLFGMRATIVVPQGAPAAKRDRITAAGAELRLVDGGYDEAHAAALELAASRGARYIHAFSDPAVVAGQGTVGLEILRDCPSPGTILVPVGGGGLIGGIGIVARALAPGARIVGVQTPPTSAMHASLEHGRLDPGGSGETLCEGLAGDIDEPSFELGRQVIDEMVLVEEAAVERAIAWLHAVEGVSVEGSGAVAVAALLEGGGTEHGGLVVAVVTGGNIDPHLLERIVESRAPTTGEAVRGTEGDQNRGGRWPTS